MEGLIPTVEIQSQQPTIHTTIGPMNFNFDEPSCLEPGQSRRKYHCPSCDKSYTQSHNLKKHRKKEHGLS